MTKAQDTPTTAAKSLTRRAILAGAVAMPALAVPALAAKGNVSFPDLAARYAAFYPRWLEQTNKSTAHLEEFTAAVSRATGLTRDQWPPFGENKEHEEIVHRISKQMYDHDPVDEEGCSIVWNELHDELYPLAQEILEQEAQSIADLALQAQAFAMAQSYYWTDKPSDENETQAIMNLVNSLCKFCGVDPLPGVKLYAVQS